MADKDIGRMSLKRLKYRYGESGGADKEAEQELRRRGLSDTKIRGVIYGFRQGEYTPKGGPYEAPVKKRVKKEAPPPKEATEPKPASDEVPVMHYGKYKGLPLTDIPEKYLAMIYAAFKQDRKRIEKELRSRGCDDEDLEYFTKKYPYLGKYPTRQTPKDEIPDQTAEQEIPEEEPEVQAPQQEPKTETPASVPVEQTPQRVRAPKTPPLSSRERILQKAEAEAMAKAKKMSGEENKKPPDLRDYVRKRKPR